MSIGDKDEGFPFGTKDGRRIAIILLSCLAGFIGYLVYGWLGMFMGYVFILCMFLIIWAAGKAEG
jgi:hypothetical protein